jgi:hypothetical protein
MLKSSAYRTLSSTKDDFSAPNSAGVFRACLKFFFSVNGPVSALFSNFLTEHTLSIVSRFFLHMSRFFLFHMSRDVTAICGIDYKVIKAMNIIFIPKVL